MARFRFFSFLFILFYTMLSFEPGCFPCPFIFFPPALRELALELEVFFFQDLILVLKCQVLLFRLTEMPIAEIKKDSEKQENEKY